MPRLSEYERFGTFGMLNDGMRVSDVARYHNCHPSTIQRLRDRYKAIGTLKDRRRSGQPRMVTSVKRQFTTIFTSTISIPAGYCQFQTDSMALTVICF